MIWLITGGSGSGKSEYAELLVCRLADGEKKKQGMAVQKLYFATMLNDGAEARERIMRHRRLRQGKGFVTVEAPFDVCGGRADCGIALVECVSNLAANLMFEKHLSAERMAHDIVSQIECLAKSCHHVVVVSNEIFSDGVLYDRETMEYIRGIGLVNRDLSQLSDNVCEVIYSIPMYLKGDKPCV